VSTSCISSRTRTPRGARMHALELSLFPRLSTNPVRSAHPSRRSDEIDGRKMWS